MLSAYTAIEILPEDEHWIDAFWSLRNFATPLDGWYAYALFDFHGRSFLQISADGLSSVKDLSRSIRNFGYWSNRDVIDWYSGSCLDDEKELLKIFQGTHFSLAKPHEKYTEYHAIYRGIGKEDALNLYSKQEVESFKLSGHKIDYYDRSKILFQILVQDGLDPREEYPRGVSQTLSGEKRNLARKFLDLDLTADIVLDVYILKEIVEKKLWFVRTRFYGAYLLETKDFIQIVGYDHGNERNLSRPLKEELTQEFSVSKWGLELKWEDKSPLQVEDVFRRFEKIKDTFYAIRRTNYEEVERNRAIQSRLYIGSSTRKEFLERPLSSDERLERAFEESRVQFEDADFYVVSAVGEFKNDVSFMHILRFREGFSCIWSRRFQLIDGCLTFIESEVEISLSKESTSSERGNLFDRKSEDIRY